MQVSIWWSIYALQSCSTEHLRIQLWFPWLKFLDGKYFMIHFPKKLYLNNLHYPWTLFRIERLLVHICLFYFIIWRLKAFIGDEKRSCWVLRRGSKWVAAWPLLPELTREQTTQDLLRCQVALRIQSDQLELRLFCQYLDM